MFDNNSGYGNAMNTVASIPGAVSPYYQPYINAGYEAGSALRPQYQGLLSMGPEVMNTYLSMMTNPSQSVNQIGSTYQASPGYDWQVEQGQAAVNNAEAAGGMLGTPEHEQEDAMLTENIADQNYYDYVDRALAQQKFGAQGASDLYQRGLGGVEGINKMGYSASTDLAEAIAQSLLAQASLQSKAGQSNRMSLGNLIGTAANIGLAIATDGASVAAKQGAKALA